MCILSTHNIKYILWRELSHCTDELSFLRSLRFSTLCSEFPMFLLVGKCQELADDFWSSWLKAVNLSCCNTDLDCGCVIKTCLKKDCHKKYSSKYFLESRLHPRKVDQIRSENISVWWQYVMGCILWWSSTIKMGIFILLIPLQRNPLENIWGCLS